jgi:hypothetical protein
MAEAYLGKALISQVWEYSTAGFPWGYDPFIRLPVEPVQSVDSITYVDRAGVMQTLAPAAYELGGAGGVYLWPAYNTTWPVARVHQRRRDHLHRWLWLVVERDPRGGQARHRHARCRLVLAT